MGLIGRILPLLLAALVFAGFPTSMVFQAIGQARPLMVSELFACAVAGAALVALGRFVLLPGAALSVARRLDSFRPPPLWLVIVAGLTFRVLIWALVEPVASSDGATYLKLANQLLVGDGYGSQQSLAYWPPGLAFALVPLLAAFDTAFALLVFSLLAYLISSWGMWKLGERIGLGAWAAWPLVMLAVWPTHVLMSGLPEKELLVIALLPWILWAALKTSSRLTYALLAGVLVGAITLVQPSFQLLPFFAVVLAAAFGAPLRRLVPALGLALLGAAIVIAPWTYRNYLVLGQTVLVSTNGGSNLYRANNELATGGYVQLGTVDVESLPELESDRVGKALAVRWIRDNPQDFLRLTAARVLLFPGDHSYGAFAAFRADPDRIPKWSYLALKAGTAATWLLLWALVLGAAWLLWLRRQTVQPETLFMLVPWLYLSGIHAFFESGSKYHLPTLACMLVWMVALFRELISSRPSLTPAR
jgi:hypothetical protein